MSLEDLTKEKSGVPCADTSQAGMTLIELLIVMALIIIMTAVTLFAFAPHRNAYRSEDEMRLITDVLADAKQRAVSKRKKVTVEIAVSNTATTAKQIRLYEGDDANPARRVMLEPTSNLRMDAAPTGLTMTALPANYPDAVFTSAAGEKVTRFTYQTNGSIKNSSNALQNLRLFIYPPTSSGSTVPKPPQAVRAITIFGTTGAAKTWAYNGVQFTPPKF